jgi:hypothetical protein
MSEPKPDFKNRDSLDAIYEKAEDEIYYIQCEIEFFNNEYDDRKEKSVQKLIEYVEYLSLHGLEDVTRQAYLDKIEGFKILQDRKFELFMRTYRFRINGSEELNFEEELDNWHRSVVVQKQSEGKNGTLRIQQIDLDPLDKLLNQI